MMFKIGFDTEDEITDSSLVAFRHWGETMEIAGANGTTPSTVNSSVRTREYLTEAEIDRLMAAARGEPLQPSGRHHDSDRLPARPAGL
jgi:hypothetical protein